MGWHSIGGSGSTTQMWVQFAGSGKPEYGVWRSATGADVDEVLGREGPESADLAGVEFWFERNKHNRGRGLVDFLWPTGVYGFKILSERFAELLIEFEPDLKMWPADVRDPDPVPGYVLVLEPVGSEGPVHSYFVDRRVNRVVVSDEVRAAVRSAKFTGLTVQAEEHPFPGEYL